jgi:PAS domain S-box-containing protein
MSEGVSYMPQDLKAWISNELFDKVPVSICVVDKEFQIIQANRRFRDLHGEWRGRYCFELYKQRSERCRDCGAQKTFDDGHTRICEQTGIDKKGQPNHYIVQNVPLVLEDGSIPYVIEMSTDITEMKKLEREKLESERLAAVGQTVAGLAHGIKNIIMGLEGGMYVVNSAIRRGNTERAVKGWRMLERDIGRISSFVKEFLEFARGKEPQVAPVEPNAIGREVINLFRDKARAEGVELEEDWQDEIAPANMDQEGIYTCLTNLVLNAIDACLMSTDEENRVVVRSRDKDGVIVFEVSDSGCGMDADIKRKVFTNFFSTKASGRGTGLGLLTTRKIVQEHGGRVSFESEEGKGSTFRLEFPRHRLPDPNVSGEADEHS